MGVQDKPQPVGRNGNLLRTAAQGLLYRGRAGALDGLARMEGAAHRSYSGLILFAVIAQVLDLDGMGLTGTIPPAFRLPPSLRKLELDNNRCGGEGSVLASQAGAPRALRETACPAGKKLACPWQVLALLLEDCRSRRRSCRRSCCHCLSAPAALSHKPALHLLEPAG